MLDYSEPTLFNANLVSWKGVEGVVQASTLFGPMLTSVPRDFRLRSDKTGNTIAFTLKRREVDREGDVICWHYRSVDRRGLSVVVLND